MSGRVRPDDVPDTKDAVGKDTAPEAAAMPQTPENLPMGPPGQKGAGLAEFEGLHLDRADIKYAAQQGVEVDALGHQISPGIRCGKSQAGCPGKIGDLLGFNQGQIFIGTRRCQP
jgi:hypothetical protein